MISRKFGSADRCDKEIVLNVLKIKINPREKIDSVSKRGENVRNKYFKEPATSSTLSINQEK